MDKTLDQHRLHRPLLVRVEEAAHILSLGRTMIYELMANGQLPSITIGTARRIPLAALEKWVADRTSYGVSS